MTDNFLISLRDQLEPKLHPGKPGTGVGATTYIVTDAFATTYNLYSDSQSSDQWLIQLRATNEKVVVFVHGFGDDADKALERHKSVKANLPSEFTLVSFDWPAGNDPFHPEEGYWADKHNAATIAPKLLTDCLGLLLEAFAADNIHLFVHSMGAFVTETAFQLGSSIKIGHVLMAAADDDRKNYANGSVTLANFLGKCADLTAYWSTADEALQFSAGLNVYIPLGLRGYPDRDTDLPNKHSLQCTDYYNVYVQPHNAESSHVWYILFQPTTPPPLENDFYIDLGEVLHGPLTHPTRALRHTLRSVSPNLA